jgi:hypothetical protein
MRRSALVLSAALALTPALPQAAHAETLCVLVTGPVGPTVGPCVPYPAATVCRTVTVSTVAVVVVCVPVVA